jgi:hypothetical protein
MTERLTLGGLLELRFSDGEAPPLDADALKALLPGIAAVVSSFRPDISALRSLVSDALVKALDVDVAPLMVATWLKYRSLIASQHTDGSATLIELTEHSFDIENEPTVDVVWNGQRVLTLHCSLQLELKLKAAQLLVRERRIHELHVGTLESEGTLSLEGKRVFSKALGSIKLPGKLSFNPGLPLTSDAWKERESA